MTSKQSLQLFEQKKVRTIWDGKIRLTDVADTEQLFRLIQSIPSPKAEPFKIWMSQVASTRIDQMQDPELSIEQANLKNTQEFEVNIENFIDSLIKNDNYDTKRERKTSAIQSRYFERKDRLNLYKTWLKTFNLGKQERLRSLLSKAKKEVEIYKK